MIMLIYFPIKNRYINQKLNKFQNDPLINIGSAILPTIKEVPGSLECGD
jgi:hypothetical protein